MCVKLCMYICVYVGVYNCEEGLSVYVCSREDVSALVSGCVYVAMGTFMSVYMCTCVHGSDTLLDGLRRMTRQHGASRVPHKSGR